MGKTILRERYGDNCNCCPEPGDDARFITGPVGVGDFYKVEQILHCYKPGEIAHIENVMIGETRNRETRRLDRFEETFITETENITETEKDSQTNTRFEQENNSSLVLSSHQQNSNGINVTADFGTVVFNAFMNNTTGSSSSQNISNATRFASNVTERSRQLEIQRMRTERTIKIIHEFEEKTTHGFVNETEINQVGVYRWVDKFYLNRLVNHGPHLLFEFLVPEPAFFHLFAKKNAGSTTDASINLVEPPAPNDTTFAWPFLVNPLKGPTNISRNNYAWWAAFYGAQVTSPPDREIILNRALGAGSAPPSAASTDNGAIEIPPGYVATYVYGDFRGSRTPLSGSWYIFRAVIGGTANLLAYFFSSTSTYSASWLNTMNKEEGKLNVSILTVGHLSNFTFNYYLICKLKDDVFEAWQAETYQKIGQPIKID